MNENSPLGNLNYLRIWHDNSGHGDKASWFLKWIVVHDLQTRERFFFICQRWLAVEKDDGVLERLLPVAGDKQNTELAYLLEKQTNSNLDHYLQTSLIQNPPINNPLQNQRIFDELDNNNYNSYDENLKNEASQLNDSMEKVLIMSKIEELKRKKNLIESMVDQVASQLKQLNKN